MNDHDDSPDIVVCLGTGTLECDTMTRSIASALGMPYNLILEPLTECRPGVYHTSVYDIKLSEIKKKLHNLNAKIILLKLSPDSFQTKQDYTSTRLMFDTLAKIFPTEDQNVSSNQWIYQQLQNNKAFCIMPFVAVHQNNSGGSHCCHMPQQLWQGNFPDFFNNKSIEIRKKILSGQRVPECAKCYEIDDNHGHSDRKSYSYDLVGEFQISSESDLEKNTALKYFHLVLDNQCNLLCRMCHPHNSNLIEKEYIQLKLLDKPVKSKKSVFDAIDYNTLEKMQVTGGEPTINDSFLDFLSGLPEGKKRTLHIMISTNAASFSKRFRSLVDEFPHLRFGVSIDGFNDLNYYIRWPSVWSKVTNNIKFLYNQGKISLFNTTVSIYNINKLFDLYNWFDENYLNIPCWMHFVDKPEIMIPWNYPNTSQILQDLDKIKNLKIYSMNQGLQDNIHYIELRLKSWRFDKDLLRKFYSFNDLLDRKRKTSLQNYNKELHYFRIGLEKQTVNDYLE